ncbi:MAG: hypothetical protein AMXMBFR34_41540 [Myxococcaceae bacterium]
MTLPSPRPLVTAAASGDRLYVFGGSTTATPPLANATDVLLDEIVAVGLSPDSATVVGRLPEPLMGACAVTRGDGTILVVGGAHYAGSGAMLALEPVDSVLVFDPATAQVTASAARLAQPRVGLACAIGPDDRVYLFGGAGPSFAPTADDAQLLPARPGQSMRELVYPRHLQLSCSAVDGGTLLALAALFYLGDLWG